MDMLTGLPPAPPKLLPKEIQISKRMPRALELAVEAWRRSNMTGYSIMAGAPALAELAAYISDRLDGSFSDHVSTKLTPKEKQILARVTRAIEMAREAWERFWAPIVPGCGDIARASAIAKLAVQIAKELEGFYPPSI